MKHHKKKYLFFIKSAAILFLCYLAYTTLSENWGQIQGIELNIKYPLLIFSLITLVPTFYVAAYGWHLALKYLQTPNINYLRSTLIWLISSYGRYVPGAIWGYLGRMYLANKNNIGVIACSNSMILETFMLAMTSFSIGAPWLISGFKVIHYFFVLIIIGLTLFLITKIHLISNTLPQKFRPLIKSFNHIKGRNIAKLYLYYLSFWVLFSIPFLLFCSALLNISITNFQLLFLIAATFPASYFAGFVAPLTPGGIGIREAVMYWMLSNHLAMTEALLISASSRIWLTSGEALNALIIYLIKKKTKNLVAV